MRMQREDKVSFREVGRPLAALDHTPDTGVAVLYGKAKATGQSRKVECGVARNLAVIDEHFRTMANAGPHDPRRNADDQALRETSRQSGRNETGSALDQDRANTGLPELAKQYAQIDTSSRIFFDDGNLGPSPADVVDPPLVGLSGR